MLLDRLRIRGKLALLVLVPVVCMLGLTLPVVGERARAAQHADDIARTVQVANRVGTLLQHLQRERMLAVGLLLRKVERSELIQQIAKVDDLVSDLRIELGDDLSAEVNAALDEIRQLAPVRTALLTSRATADQILGTYAPVHRTLIDSLRLPYDVDTRTSVGRQVLALDRILRKSEGISAGSALIVLIAAAPDPALVTAYVANMATLQADSDQLIGLLSPEQLVLLDIEQAAVDARAGQDFLEQSALDPVAAVSQLPVDVLYPTTSSLITLGQFVEKKLVADVTTEVRAERQAALFAAYWVTALVLLILLAVGLLALVISRSVAQPLTRLTRSADRVARVAESELLRVADDEAHPTQSIRLDRIEIRGRDEIGDLARAFERVQSTAAQLVERQVASRRNVAQMFGHVGRRTQNLVGRQIALIDQLEQQETEPARLENLYRLDHISSRLRRNADNLVVLSGAAGDVVHTAPVPLADVVRLALGEIEDYTRVDVRVPSDVAAAPAIVGDLVLALAELMENATVFSPPHTRVVVDGELTDDGAQLTVVDHGIGMTEARLADENARLTRRERLDLAPTEVLGLFVVGRLARRHGWRVVLSATPGGGVTAILLVPRPDLVFGTPEPTGTHVTPITTRPVLPAHPQPVPVSPSRPGEGLTVGGPSETVGFDQRLLVRATASIELADSWNAFATGGRQAATVPAGATAASPAGIGSASGEIPPVPPASSGASTQLTRRVPGANLVTVPTRQQLTDHPGDPAEVRDLINAFESGVARALREIRPDRSNET